VNILIEEEEGEFVLEIKDNGRGITEGEKLGTRSLGLLGMREALIGRWNRSCSRGAADSTVPPTE